MSCTDYIEIKDLSVFGNHGVMPEENVVGQKFLVGVKLYFDMSKAGRSDDLTKTLDYSVICQEIKDFVENNTFKLIEKLAESIADMLLLKYDIIEKVDVSIKKPWAPIHIDLDTVLVNVSRAWHKVCLSLGSNMGDKKKHIDTAIDNMKENELIRLCKIAGYIVTAPVGFTEQDDFLNTAVTLKTLYKPHELLDFIHEVENKGDRKRVIHWGPRTIDIDIIFYDDFMISDEDLVIPHPECCNREFVLKPLSEIAPYYRHPGNKLTVRDILTEYYDKTRYIVNDSYDSGFTGIDSLRVKSDTKVAFFGVEGTYSQQAMERFFGDGGYISYPLPEFVSVMAAVEKGEADFGVVPIENSSTGGITDIYDHMNEYDVHIVGEQIIKIEHALIGLEGVDANDIKTVYSHAQGIRQCAGFLKAHPWIQPVEVGSTAQGAKRVADDHDPSIGAIAGVQAAKVYNLNVIENAINDQGNNRTRFVILTKAKNYINNSKKISISFEVKHESGALYRILSHFYNNGINLEKIESRPILGKTWEYRFFVDIAGNLKMQGVKNALYAIENDADNVKILGNY